MEKLILEFINITALMFSGQGVTEAQVRELRSNVSEILSNAYFVRDSFAGSDEATSLTDPIFRVAPILLRAVDFLFERIKEAQKSEATDESADSASATGPTSSTGDVFAERRQRLLALVDRAWNYSNIAQNSIDRPVQCAKFVGRLHELLDEASTLAKALNTGEAHAKLERIRKYRDVASQALDSATAGKSQDQ